MQWRGNKCTVGNQLNIGYTDVVANRMTMILISRESISRLKKVYQLLPFFFPSSIPPPPQEALLQTAYCIPVPSSLRKKTLEFSWFENNHLH